MGESRRNLEQVWWGVVAAVVLVVFVAFAAFAAYVVRVRLEAEVSVQSHPSEGNRFT